MNVFFPLDCHPGAAAELIDLQTFSQFEMCFNLIGLLHPDMVGLAQTTAMVADLSGNMRSIPNLNDHLNKLRADLLQQAAAKKAVIRDDQLDKEVRRCVLAHLLPPT
jgi:3-oxoacyl-ACP reductase-like protein